MHHHPDSAFLYHSSFIKYGVSTIEKNVMPLLKIA